jgi:hypothetical protein
VGIAISNEGEKMKDLYMKNKKGQYLPVSIKELDISSWSNKVVHITLGSDSSPSSEEEENQLYRSLNDSDLLEALGATLVITSYEINFEVLGNVSELEDKPILIRVNSNDSSNLSFDESLEKRAKRLLRERGVGKKHIVMPAPINVKQYKEVMDVKRRCDIRRERRG